MRSARVTGMVVVGILAAASLAPVASATSPGRNGRIFFSALDGCGVASVSPSGTGYNCVDPIGTNPAISPDLKHIVSVRGEMPSDVYASDINGRHVKRLTRTQSERPDGLSPSFSPDSRRVLWFKFGGDSGVDGLYLMNADGSGQHQLASDRGQDPVLSPNGARIAYSARGVAIAVANADGTGSQVILPDQNTTTPGPPPGRYLEQSRQPSWAPDGRRIAFARRTRTSTVTCFTSESCVQTVDATDVWLMNPDGTGLRQLTSTPGVEEEDPSFSPDGQRIAYYRKPTGHDDREGEIWVMNADGSGQRRLALGGNPEWSSLRGGPAKPVLRVRTQRINRRRSCLGRLDGVVASVKTTALRATGFHFQILVGGKTLAEESNTRLLGAGIDEIFPRRKTYRFKVILDDPAVGDGSSRMLTIHRC